MLQQTQVKTVTPYWERWMQALPTVEALARARPERIHKLWEGLGYYTRVRNMQKAARLIVKEHAGLFPQDYEDVLALPGIGRYTAGAVCSIAFNQPLPVLDGNVTRVLTRVFGIDGNPREKQTNARLWDLATRLVQGAGQLKFHRADDCFVRAATGSCSALNQSLMELGALVCTARTPQCAECPLRQHCVAFRRGWVDRLPNFNDRRQTTKRRFVAFVVRQGDRYLIRQRPAGVINAHLWEFPNLEVSHGNGDISAAFRQLFGTGERHLEPLCSIKHTITRYRITLDVFREALGNKPTRFSGRWVNLARMQSLAFPSAHKQILECLE
jgi:A/G-specific adenine glycosylase